MVALTDGEDTVSRLRLDSLLARVGAGAPPLFVVGLGRTVQEAPLRDLAAVSGGAYYGAESPEGLAHIYRRIAEGLKSEYLISYQIPERAEKASVHRVAVRLSPAGTSIEEQRTFSVGGGGAARARRGDVPDGEKSGARPRAVLFAAAGMAAGLLVGAALVSGLRVGAKKAKRVAGLVFGLAALLGALLSQVLVFLR